jgi:hypothetical protein
MSSTEGTPDVEALQARIAELESQKGKRRFDGRGFSAWVVLVVAALLFPLALTAFWAQRTLTDTERFVATVAPLSDDPTIQKAVGDKVTEGLITRLDAQNRVEELLAEYPRLAALSGPIASGVNSLVERTVDEILASEQFDDVWVAINERAQEALVAALEGKEDGAVTITNGQVVLDTGELFTIVQQRLVDRGLSFAANIPLPPVADRQIVLLESAELERAQFFYAIGQPVAQWLIFVVLLMFVGAVLLSRNRPRMTIAVGVSLLIGAAVVRLGLVFGQNQISLSLQDTPFALAERAFFTILTVFLIDAIRATFVLGLILIVIGWYLGRSKAATRLRGSVSGVLSGAGDRASGGPLAEVGAFVSRTRTVWRVLIIAIAVGVVLLSNQVTGSLLLWTAVLAVLGLAVVEFLTAAGRGVEAAGDQGAVEPADDEPAAAVSD